MTGSVSTGMRQFVTAVVLALPFLALAVFAKRVRRAGALMSGAILGWGLWAQLPAETEDVAAQAFLPLTPSFLAFLSAGIATVLAGLLPWDKVPSAGMRRFGRAGAVAASAGLLSALVFAISRSTGLAPITGGALEIAFGALGALHLGILAGLALVGAELFVEYRREKRSSAAW
jgi:hypothetical protein